MFRRTQMLLYGNMCEKESLHGHPNGKCYQRERE